MGRGAMKEATRVESSYSLSPSRKTLDDFVVSDKMNIFAAKSKIIEDYGNETQTFTTGAVTFILEPPSDNR